jgi:hypothetical protein
MPGAIRATIRDGRAGRDPAQVTSEGHGPVLETRECARPFDIGDRLTLSDGTEVVVIGADERIGQSWEQTVHIGHAR